MKKVSVVIPTCNRQDELIKSISTVLDQTYKGDIELIIVDDTKKSQKNMIDSKFLDKIRNSKNRSLVYIHNPEKKGAPYARNIGIKEAKGEIIAFLDDDDLWLPEKIEKQLKLFDDEKVGLVVCHSLDKRFGKERISKPPENVDHKYILDSFNFSSTSSYVLRKNVVKDEGGFDIDLPSAQEYDLAIRISKNYKVRCVPEVLMIQHATDGQISEDWQRKIRGLIDVYHKHGREYMHSSFFNNFKFVGMLFLFTMGFFFGNKIYGLITPAKEIYEE